MMIGGGVAGLIVLLSLYRYYCWKRADDFSPDTQSATPSKNKKWNNYTDVNNNSNATQMNKNISDFYDLEGNKNDSHFDDRSFVSLSKTNKETFDRNFGNKNKDNNVEVEIANVDDIKSARVMSMRASSAKKNGDYEDAEQCYTNAYQLRLKVLGPHHHDTITSQLKMKKMKSIRIDGNNQNDNGDKRISRSHTSYKPPSREKSQRMNRSQRLTHSVRLRDGGVSNAPSTAPPNPPPPPPSAPPPPLPSTRTPRNDDYAMYASYR
jgi:hypothetical protein